jgi:acetoin utilization deacetylase AcuC-like enzyme
MKAVFHHNQLLHNPQRYLSRGHIVGFPEQPERAKRLLRGAKAAGCEMHAARAHGEAHILAVHTGRYVKFLQNAFRKWNRPKGKAYEEVMSSIRPVEKPARYPSDILGQAGWHQQDFSCPITEQTWTSVKASADTVLSAAELVVEGEKAAYALCRPPGHHAYADRAGGFCYLNNSAIAAQYLRQSWDQVAILDIDVHHGNGTQGIFYDRADVLTVSIHADPKKYYPFYYGYENQRGKGPGMGYNINIPVPVKSDDEVWMGALEMALGELQDAAPGALVIALGLDAHEADPLNGGAVTTAGFTRMAHAIARLDLPTVIVQEGGYLTDDLENNLTAFLKGFGG